MKEGKISRKRPELILFYPIFRMSRQYLKFLWKSQVYFGPAAHNPPSLPTHSIAECGKKNKNTLELWYRIYFLNNVNLSNQNTTQNSISECLSLQHELTKKPFEMFALFDVFLNTEKATIFERLIRTNIICIHFSSDAQIYIRRSKLTTNCIISDGQWSGMSAAALCSGM